MNKIPYVSWKGQTLQQITSVLRRNKSSMDDISKRHISKAMPLKLYRREIVVAGNPNSGNCSRASVKIANFEQPGQAIVHSPDPSYSVEGIKNVLDITTIKNTGEHPGQCSSTCNDGLAIFSPETNARRRCRSAGMIPKKFNVNRNNDQYYTSTNQYLVSRNRTFQQNGYVYLRQGSSGVQPGTGNSKSNIYSPQGLSHCKQPIISEANGNNTFRYIWLDQLIYDVVIPDGKYDIDALRNAIYTVMVGYGHYFYNLSTGAKSFPISFSYNTYDRSVIIEANPVIKDTYGETSTYSPTFFGTPSGTTWYDLLLEGTHNTYVNLTTFGFASMIGFPLGTIQGRQLSSLPPQIYPNYVTLYYKPSNQTFGQQGSVDSSAYTHREKLNAVTKGGYLTKSAYGSAVADALAYGVSEQPFTLKQTIGYKSTETPVIKDGKVCNVKNYIYRRG